LLGILTSSCGGGQAKVQPTMPPEKIITRGPFVGSAVPTNAGAWQATRTGLIRCLRAAGWRAESLVHPTRVRARSTSGKRVTWTVYFGRGSAARAAFDGEPTRTEQRTLLRCLH
jgi:hypothetical protein